MAKLKLGKREPTDYGRKYRGRVEAENGNIPITWREPDKHERSEIAYVLATGWLGEKCSMRIPAHEAVKMGHIAISFDYTNTRFRHPVKQNEENLRNVIDALPTDLRRAAIGLSMGGRVLTAALSKVDTRVEAATLVAPAGYLKDGLSRLKAVENFIATTPETIDTLTKNPQLAYHLSASVIHNLVHRNVAVLGEMEDLMVGSVRELVPQIKDKLNPPHMRFMYGSRDRLLPADLQIEGAADLPFDHIEPYPGGHLDLVRKKYLARKILELDSDILGPTSTPTPENLKLAA